jgi:hypothetical protein
MYEVGSWCRSIDCVSRPGAGVVELDLRGFPNLAISCPIRTNVCFPQIRVSDFHAVARSDVDR